MQSIKSLVLILALLALSTRAQAQLIVSVQVIGQSCGATLTAVPSTASAMRFTVLGSSNTAGILVFGTTIRTFQLPGGCVLHTDPLFVVPYKMGAAANFSLLLPHVLTGRRGMIRLQGFPLIQSNKGIQIRASNAMPARP